MKTNQKVTAKVNRKCRRQPKACARHLSIKTPTKWAQHRLANLSDKNLIVCSIELNYSAFVPPTLLTNRLWMEFFYLLDTGCFLSSGRTTTIGVCVETPMCLNSGWRSRKMQERRIGSLRSNEQRERSGWSVGMALRTKSIMIDSNIRNIICSYIHRKTIIWLEIY